MIALEVASTIVFWTVFVVVVAEALADAVDKMVVILEAVETVAVVVVVQVLVDEAKLVLVIIVVWNTYSSSTIISRWNTSGNSSIWNSDSTMCSKKWKSISSTGSGRNSSSWDVDGYISSLIYWQQ